MRRRFGRRYIHSFRGATLANEGLYESTVNTGQPFLDPPSPGPEKDDTRGISGKVPSFALQDEANKVENENYRDRSINMAQLGGFNEIRGPREEWMDRRDFCEWGTETGEKDILLDRIVNENFNRNADACIQILVKY